MKYCPRCGLRNDDNSAICEGCGAIMVKKKEKEKKKGVLPIILVALLLVAGVAAFIYHRASLSGKTTVPVPTEFRPASTEAVTVPTESEAPETESTVPDTVPIESEAPETESTVPDITEETREPLIYDDRVAAYSGENPKWETMHFEWVCQNGRDNISLDIPVDKNMYLYYRGLQRYYGVENMYLYINDEDNREIVRSIVAAMRDVANRLSFDDAAVAREIVKFVQDVIVYEYDSVSTGQEEYPRYPIETLYEKQGDCEDTSILMAALLKEWGYEVGLLHLPGHAAVAIRTSDNYNATDYYEINGHRYLFIESTGSGWSIGQIPDDFLETGAELYVVP